ncbi:MAG: FAD-binding oxidoreductase, partial [Candidatus Methanomethylophilus sp.]|nr:FAD-binding oxidoreductase [Methanomethylophilus sp.]
MDSEKLTREVTPEIIEKLAEIVGKDNINTSEMDRQLYSHDLAPLPKEAGVAFKNVPDVIVRPTSTQQVAAVMRLAYETGVAVTPRGNSTWGLGGSMPIAAGILLDMSSKMNNIIAVDPENMCVKAQAGATWKSVLDTCMEKGFIIGSYPSSFPAATLGAWIMTNGMGVGSYKYGAAKDNILNMQVVTPDGTVLETGYDHIGSYMSGYNLNQLFAGSEGTLGVICNVTFRMYPMGVIKPLAYEFENLKDADPAIQDITKNASLRPLHISWSDYNHFANQRKAGVAAPDVKNVVLITMQEDQKVLDVEVPMVDEIMAAHGGKRVDDAIADHEWSERCYEFRARKAGVGEIPAEVIVPTKNWGQFVDECYEGFKVMKME